jgi:oxygen-independent coproporphyrinogen III oxidase
MQTHESNLAPAVLGQATLKRFDLNGPRYTSYPTADHFSDTVGAEQFSYALAAGNGAITSLYIHIPFCRSLCHYCACNKIVTKSSTVADEYLNALEKEIECIAALGGRLPLAQIAFGGGTPNFFSIDQFERLFQTLTTRFRLVDAREQSIEIDPRYLPLGYFDGLRRLGFNRVSFGVQDFDEPVQALIHRHQSFEQTRFAVAEARESGIESISFDLVYGLPIQSRETFSRTLERVLHLDPDRIALFNYAHIPERFKAQRRIPTASLPNIDERVALFLYARERLGDAGYVAIGLDHFAKPDDGLARALRERTLRRNFQGYSSLPCDQLIGIGVSAISQFKDLYTQNYAQLDAYYERVQQHHPATQRGVQLNADDQVRARVIERIMCHGLVDWREIETDFSLGAREYFHDEWLALESYVAHGIVELSDAALRVSERGRLLLRAVAMVFDARRSASRSRIGIESPVRFSPIA